MIRKSGHRFSGRPYSNKVKMRLSLNGSSVSPQRIGDAHLADKLAYFYVTAGRPQRCFDFNRQYDLSPARCQRIRSPVGRLQMRHTSWETVGRHLPISTCQSKQIEACSLEAEIFVLRQQINVLRRANPQLTENRAMLVPDGLALRAKLLERDALPVEERHELLGSVGMHVVGKFAPSVAEFPDTQFPSHMNGRTPGRREESDVELRIKWSFRASVST